MRKGIIALISYGFLITAFAILIWSNYMLSGMNDRLLDGIHKANVEMDAAQKQLEDSTAAIVACRDRLTGKSGN